MMTCSFSSLHITRLRTRQFQGMGCLPDTVSSFNGLRENHGTLPTQSTAGDEQKPRSVVSEMFLFLHTADVIQ